VNACSLTLNESGDSTPSEADFCTDRCFSCFYTSTHVLLTVTSKHYNTDNPSAPAERQSNWMSKITNDGLTWSGTGCFIAVPMWQQWVSNVNFSIQKLKYWSDLSDHQQLRFTSSEHTHQTAAICGRVQSALHADSSAYMWMSLESCQDTFSSEASDSTCAINVSSWTHFHRLTNDRHHLDTTTALNISTTLAWSKTFIITTQHALSTKHHINTNWIISDERHKYNM